MTPLLHGTVSQHIVFATDRDTVWRAFADLDVRDRWFTMPGERSTRSHELDFRVGGLEITRGTFSNMGEEERLEHRSRFLDIVGGERISTVYELRLNDVLQFVALASVELTDVDTGTRVDYTEQHQFFVVRDDGSAELGERQGGTRFLLRRLSIALAQAS